MWAEFLGFQGTAVKMTWYVLCAETTAKRNKETQITDVSTCKTGTYKYLF